MKHGAGASRHANIPRLQHFIRHERRVHQVPQFMREEPEPGRLSIDTRLRLPTPVLRHRARDGIVEASVQYAKSSVLIGAFRSTASSVMA